MDTTTLMDAIARPPEEKARGMKRPRVNLRQLETRVPAEGEETGRAAPGRID